MALTQVAAGLLAGSITSSQITSVAASTLTGTQTLPRGTLPTGSVLQVVQTVTNSTYSVNSTSMTATGFIGSITPTSASSKILVSINGGQFRYNPTGGAEMQELLYRSIGGGGYSQIVGDLTEIIISPANGIFAVPHSLVYLDSPATTSSVSYQPYLKSTSGPITTYFNLNAVYVTMTLMEISA